MKIIDRYVGKEILVTGLFAVSVLSLVLVLGNVFKQLLDLLVNHDVPLEYIFSFIAYILPFSLTFTIPWGFLTAVLLVFGKMSAENELIALRSNGVSIPRLCVPLAVLAVACSAICLWINVDIAPRAQQNMKNALFNIATSNPIAMFSSDQVIDEFPGKKIYVERKEGTHLFNLLVYELNDKGEPTRMTHAQRGELTTDLENRQVLMRLKDVRFEQRDESTPGDLTRIRQGITMREGTFPLPLEELYEKNKRRRGLSQMPLKELLDDSKARKMNLSEITAARTEVNKRFSFSLASIAFALVGVPLAITAHRKETSVGFLFSLLVAFIYFFFIIVANGVRENPKAHPELLIWAPNIIFITLGSWMFYRLAKK
ncbi:MAG: LptF/LptG family permease [Verrucomicrobiota bacterium]